MSIACKIRALLGDLRLRASNIVHQTLNINIRLRISNVAFSALCRLGDCLQPWYDCVCINFPKKNTKFHFTKSHNASWYDDITQIPCIHIEIYCILSHKNHQFVRQVKSRITSTPRKNIKQTAAKNTGPAHGVGGLCGCMRCFSSWKAAWAGCTCAGAARFSDFSLSLSKSNAISCLALYLPHAAAPRVEVQ